MTYQVQVLNRFSGNWSTVCERNDIDEALTQVQLQKHNFPGKGRVRVLREGLDKPMTQYDIECAQAGKARFGR